MGLGPGLGREVGDASLRMGGDTQEHVAQVGKGLDAGELARLDERVEDGGAVSAGHAASEQPVLAADRHGTELALGTGMPRVGLCRVGSTSLPSLGLVDACGYG